MGEGVEKEVFVIYQEMITDLIGLLKRRVERAELLTMIAIIIMLLNAILFVAGGVYIVYNSNQIEQMEEYKE